MPLSLRTEVITLRRKTYEPQSNRLYDEMKRRLVFTSGMTALRASRCRCPAIDQKPTVSLTPGTTWIQAQRQMHRSQTSEQSATIPSSRQAPGIRSPIPTKRRTPNISPHSASWVIILPQTSFRVRCAKTQHLKPRYRIPAAEPPPEGQLQRTARASYAKMIQPGEVMLALCFIRYRNFINDCSMGAFCYKP